MIFHLKIVYFSSFQFTLVSTVQTCLMDVYPKQLRVGHRPTLLLLFICVVLYIAGLNICTQVSKVAVFLGRKVFHEVFWEQQFRIQDFIKGSQPYIFFEFFWKPYEIEENLVRGGRTYWIHHWTIPVVFQFRSRSICSIDVTTYFQGGMYVLQLMDNYSATYGLVTVGIFICIALGWVYGKYPSWSFYHLFWVILLCSAV